MLDNDKLVVRLLEALGASLDIHVVLRDAYPLLTQLVSADYGALGVSHSAKPEDFEWMAVDLPPIYFEAYPEMAAHDFVRAAVAKEPNRVLADQDMVSRRELEQNMMYLRARELGVPIEQVMAVMLHIDDRWQSGLSLYRDRRRPFSDAERAILQKVTPAIANAVRNCHQFGLAEDWRFASERLLTNPATSLLLVAANGTELARSDSATRLMEKWFAPHQQRGKRLPEPLQALLKTAVSSAQSCVWRKRNAEATLEVSLLSMAGYSGATRWLLHLTERPHESPVPQQWQPLLTERERHMTSGVLGGSENSVIGQQQDCALATVKKHLQNIYQKLGIETRAQLLARAFELERQLEPDSLEICAKCGAIRVPPHLRGAWPNTGEAPSCACGVL